MLLKTVHHWNERTRKERRPELVGAGGRARLVVLGGEVGGRFSDETAHFLRSLASAKVWGMSELLQGRAHAAVMRKWCSMLGRLVSVGPRSRRSAWAG